jgi:anti-sigma regulatory factor (Ser/Thr protein kinase)
LRSSRAGRGAKTWHVARKPEDTRRVSPAAWTEDMDTSHRRVLTASGCFCQATPARDPLAARRAGDRPPAGPPIAQAGTAQAGTAQPPIAPPGIAQAATAHADAACALGPELRSVGIGRSFTRMMLRQWGLAGLCDQAELVVSELVTNAIQHGLLSARRTIEEYPVSLRLLAQAPFVTFMVTDPGSKLPIHEPGEELAESGRGLRVVESCSRRWGWQPLEAGGKVVWAQLEQDLRRRRRTACARATRAGR